MKRREFFGVVLGGLVAAILPKRNLTYNANDWYRHDTHIDRKLTDISVAYLESQNTLWAVDVFPIIQHG